MKRLVFSALFLMLFSAAAMAQGMVIAPESRAYQAWERDILAGKAPATETASGRPLGRRPSPVDYSHLVDKSIAPRSPFAFFTRMLWSLTPSETAFDLRDQNGVTPITNQNPTGSCWTFSVIAAAESAYKVASGVTTDLSESHLTYYGYNDVDTDLVGFDLPSGWSAYDHGGYAGQAAAILFRGTGAVGEADAPWSTAPYPSNTSGTTPSPTPPNSRRIDNIYIIPQSTNYLDQKDNIKYALKEYGAVSIGMYWVDSAYNTTTYGFHYNGNEEANHQVTIVGWDDNYSRTNFITQPSGDGAWIVRNSWGGSNDWPQSDDGYFFISYHDTGVLGDFEGGFVFMSTDPTAYAHTYSHTPLGQTGSLDGGTNTNEVANVFTAEAAHSIGAVGVVNTDVNTTYELRIYTGVTDSPDTGTLAYSTLGTFDMPGFLTVPLTTPVTVADGEKFAVVFKLTTPNTTKGIAIEYPSARLNTSKATSSPGQSYIWDSVRWTDLYDSDQMNACIYAFALEDTSSPAYLPAIRMLLQ